MLTSVVVFLALCLVSVLVSNLCSVVFKDFLFVFLADTTVVGGGGELLGHVRCVWAVTVSVQEFRRLDDDDDKKKIVLSQNSSDKKKKKETAFI